MAFEVAIEGDFSEAAQHFIKTEDIYLTWEMVK